MIIILPRQVSDACMDRAMVDHTPLYSRYLIGTTCSSHIYIYLYNERMVFLVNYGYPPSPHPPYAPLRRAAVWNACTPWAELPYLQINPYISVLELRITTSHALRLSPSLPRYMGQAGGGQRPLQTKKRCQQTHPFGRILAKRVFTGDVSRMNRKFHAV